MLRHQRFPISRMTGRHTRIPARHTGNLAKHAQIVETTPSVVDKIAAMAGVRGLAHPKTTNFNGGREMRATVVLKAGETARAHYEELVKHMGVSGAEVLREALAELHQKLLPQQQTDPGHEEGPGFPARAS